MVEHLTVGGPAVRQPHQPGQGGRVFSRGHFGPGLPPIRTQSPGISRPGSKAYRREADGQLPAPSHSNLQERHDLPAHERPARSGDIMANVAGTPPRRRIGGREYTPTPALPAI